MGDDLKLLIRAARAAAPLAMQHWKANPDFWEKPDGAGPVSKADLLVDDALRALLTSARPSYGWLSEESADNADRLTREATFIVDPIDGTRAYLAGEKSWALSLAVVRDGLAETGVIYLPAMNRIYAARRGAGATMNDTAITASKQDRMDQAQVLAARIIMQPQYWRCGVPPFQPAFRPSLAYRMALVAEGRFDGMLTLRPSWEWDIAAGSLIAEEAGAIVTDRAGRKPVFNNPTPKLSGILAAAPAIHEALITQLAA